MSFNKVAILYEIAQLYLSLDHLNKFLLATHFRLIDVEEFMLPEAESDVIILKRVVERELYHDFKGLASAYACGKFSLCKQ